MDYLALPIGDDAPTTVNAVVEIPGGQANKYEYDKALGVFRLDRPLYSSVHYPGDYGFIPSTLAEDGDALDILVLTLEPTFSGCLVEARPIGVLKMLDQNVSDEKILAVVATSAIHQAVKTHADLAPHVLKEIEHFFSVYKALEEKHTTIQGWGEVAHAHELIRKTHQRFADTHRRA